MIRFASISQWAELLEDEELDLARSLVAGLLWGSSKQGDKTKIKMMQNNRNKKVHLCLMQSTQMLTVIE